MMIADDAALRYTDEGIVDLLRVSGYFESSSISPVPFELCYLALRLSALRSLSSLSRQVSSSIELSGSPFVIFLEPFILFMAASMSRSPLKFFLPLRVAVRIKIFLEIFHVKLKSDIIKSHPKQRLLTLTFSMFKLSLPSAARHVVRVNSEKL
jgi:hypothetical protein